MKNSHLLTRTAVCRLACSLIPLSLGATMLQASETAEEPTKDNYIIFSATGTDLNGSEDAFRARTNRTSSFQGGFQAIHFEEALANDWSFELDAGATFDESEYELELVLEKEGFNRTTIGFENYRYWSDARTVDIAGSPLLEPFDPSLYLDRSKFFIESTFYPSDVFDFTLRYTYRERDGEKTSTSWGDSDFNSRKAVPSLWMIDETHHKFEVEAERRWEDSTLKGGVSWDHSEMDNSLNYVRSFDGTTGDYWTQTDIRENDTIAANGAYERRISEQLLLNLSAMYSHLNGDVAGDRIKGDSFGAAYDPAKLSGYDHGFINLDGDFDLDQYVATFGALYQPAENWFITPSIRFETTSRDAIATEVATSAANRGGEHDLAAESENDYDSVAAELGARYSGITNWTFYADAFASYGEGDHFELQYDITDPLDPDVERDTDYERTQTKLTLGANWYAHPKVTVAMKAYYKTSDNDYDHDSLNPNDYSGYVVEQQRDTLGANLRVNWRIASNLTSVSRFDYQESTIDSQVEGKSMREIADRERFSYSQSLNYQANARLTLMASLNFVNDKLTTGGSDLYNGNNSVVADSNMDYFYGQLSGVYIYSDTVNLTASIGSLLSDNEYDNSAVSTPYGSNLSEYHLTLGVSKKLADNKVISLGYGYYDYEDDTLSGEGDFDAHIFTAEYEYRF